MASVTEEVKFKFYISLFNLNRHMWLIATLLITQG